MVDTAIPKTAHPASQRRTLMWITALVCAVLIVAWVWMLPRFFEQRGPVLAGTFGVLVGSLVVSQFLPKLSYILPLSMDKIAMSILQGQPLSLPMMYELITAGLFSILFVVAALWRFGDEEF